MSDPFENHAIPRPALFGLVGLVLFALAAVVIAVARRLFADRGFYGTSIAAIGAIIARAIRAIGLLSSSSRPKPPKIADHCAIWAR